MGVSPLVLLRFTLLNPSEHPCADNKVIPRAGILEISGALDNTLADASEESLPLLTTPVQNGKLRHVQS